MSKINKLEEVRHLITMHCNLECLHCYLKGGGEKNCQKQNIIDEDILKKFYLKYQPNVVSATGGEPLLNKKMVKLLGKVINNYGGALEIVTNGTLIDKDFVEEMQSINPNTFYQISLDGMRDYHNFLRNNNTAFERAIRGIKIISDKKVHLKVRFTATDENYEELPELIDLLDSFENENIELVIRPVVSTGRAKDNNLFFSKDYTILNNLKSRIIKISTTDNSGKCGCGVNTVAINDQGNIYPCNYTVGNDNYLMGSIYDDVDLFEDKEFKNFKGNCYARHLQMFPIQRKKVS